MRRFVVPALHPGVCTLGPDDSHHLLRVLRARRGSAVGLTDGLGTVADGTLVDVVDDRARIEVQTLRVERSGPERTVLLGVPKAGLSEEAIQLGTEAGATHFICVPAQRSPLPAPRIERLERILAAAAEQSGRARLPTLTMAPDLPRALAVLGPGDRLLAHPGAPRATPTEGPAIVAIGPEGGWTDDERATMRTARFVEAGFGPHVLRAPTAVAVTLGALLPLTASR